jgi:TolB protein
MYKHIILFISTLFCLQIFCFAEEKILFSSLTNGFWQIFVMDTTGQNITQLTNSPVDKRYPTYLKNQNKILYRTNNNELFSINTNGENETQMLSDFGEINAIDYCDRLKKFVIVRFRQDVKDVSDLWLCDLDGRNKEILTNNPGLQYNPMFSPDAKQIIYVSGYGFGTHEIFVIDIAKKTNQQLTTNKALDFLPIFSPKGKQIAYVSDITGNYEIWVMDNNGKNQKQLTNSEGIDTRPYWSANGKHIIFTSNRTGSLQLWKMNADGSNQTQMTFQGESNDSCWIEDNQ